jgi:hypothetical protein
MRGKGVWISRDEILMLVYGAKGQLEKHLFAVDLSRMKEQIKEGAEGAGLLNRATADAASLLEEVNLFEHSELDANPQWRLSPLCEVEVFDGLDSWHQRVLFAREEDGDSTIGLVELRLGCLQVKQVYGGGLLARYQDTLAIWQWAEEASIMYRNKCRDVLQYAAEREWAYARDQRQPVRERREAVRRSAQLHGWIALVMSGLFPDVEESKQALILCLKRYDLLRGLVAARSVFQQYALQMRDKDAEWEPGTEITEVWPEATQLRFRRTRKNSQQEEQQQ